MSITFGFLAKSSRGRFLGSESKLSFLSEATRSGLWRLRLKAEITIVKKR